MMESSWSNVRSDIDEYAKSLKKKYTMMKQLHMSNSCISNPIENGVSITRESCDVNQVAQTFRPLDNLLADEDEYHPICLNDLDIIQSMDKRMRYKYFKSLQTTHLSRPLVYYKYSPYSGINSYHFIWILPAQSCDRDDSQFANLSPKYPRTYQSNTPDIYGLHFEKDLVRWCQPKPVLLDEMYRYLTNDCSTPRNRASKEVQERLLFAMTCEDTDVIVDLREHHGSQEKYSDFWEGINDVFTRDFPSATEE